MASRKTTLVVLLAIAVLYGFGSHGPEKAVEYFIILCLYVAGARALLRFFGGERVAQP